MMTPFGNAIASYPSKQEFYNAYPELAEGWDVEGHPGAAPLGYDLVPGGGNQDRQWLVTFCTAERNTHGLRISGRGTVVAFDRESSILHVLAPNIEFEDAEAKYLS